MRPKPPHYILKRDLVCFIRLALRLDVFEDKQCLKKQKRFSESVCLVWKLLVGPVGVILTNTFDIKLNVLQNLKMTGNAKLRLNLCSPVFSLGGGPIDPH